MSPLQFLRILVARWKLIFGAMAACMLVATTVAMLLPKRYPATARVLLGIGSSDPVTGEVIGFRDRGYVGTQAALVKDMRVAGEAVDRLGLANNPATIAAYRATGRTEADGGIRAWLGQRIIDNLDARLVPGTSIMAITYQASNPEQAKAIVGVVREAYVDESLRFRTDAASRSGNWFREQSDKARAALASAEGDLADFMEKNDIIVVGGMDSDTARLAQLQASLQQARGAQSGTDAEVANRLANDPVVDQLQMQLSTIEDQIALAGARLGSEHPEYRALLARRSTLTSEISRAQAKSRTTVGTMAGVANQSVAKLEGQVAAQERVVLDRKPVLDEFTRLSREVDMKRTQYEHAVAQSDQLRLQADVSEGEMVVLGDPVASNTPSYPKVNLIIGMAAFFGLALGTLSAILAEFIARRIRGFEDLAFAAGAPVLVTVSAIPRPAWRQKVVELLSRRRRKGDSSNLQAI